MSDQLLTVQSGPPVVALGAWFKNTVCAMTGTQALVSATVGDLDGVEACLAHENTASRLLDWLGQTPLAVAHDLHPDFHSTRFAQETAEQLGVPAIGVQHHHAHIEAVRAEHQLTETVIGLALDGVGLGSDGQAWGGELLLVGDDGWQRLAGLRPLSLPGGDRAAREPWRMAAAVLHDLGRGEQIATRFPEQPAAAHLHQLLTNTVRCPPTSSMGRVFDAAAGLLGLSTVMANEAEAAIALESSAAGHGPVAAMPDGWSLDADGRLDLRPLLATLVEETDPGAGAARFHATLAAALADWACRAAHRHDVGTVALAGGCFFNRILSADLPARLQQSGLRVLLPQALLPGDTAVSFGQAAVVRRLAEVM